MKIIIVGAGFTGVQLAKRLVSEKNDVVLIDNDEETVRHLSDRVDCLVVQANGNSLETLESAGIAKADALVALTESDELNMITCSLVDSVYPDVFKIARVRNDEYYANSKLLAAQKWLENTSRPPLYGIDVMVHPDVEAAKIIVAAYEHGAVAEVMEFEDSPYAIASLDIEAGSSLEGILVQAIKPLVPFRFLITVVSHNGESFLPRGDTKLYAGDTLSLLLEKSQLPEFLKLAGTTGQKPIKRVALVGAGKVGSNVADGILKKSGATNFFSKVFDKRFKPKINLVIIEKDRELAKEAKAKFPEADVINADITDESFIFEEGDLSSYDLVIAATRNHELNIVTSAYFKAQGCSKSICLVTSSSYASITRNIGIDVVVPIKDTVVDTIMSHLRGKSVTGIHTLSEGSFEVVEYELPKNSKADGKALKDLRSGDETFLILLVNKGESYGIADGNTVLSGGDKLVFIADVKDTKHVLDKFGD